MLALFLIVSLSGNIVQGSSYGYLKINEKNLSKTVKAMEKDYKELEDYKEEKLEESCDKYYEGKLRKLLSEEDIEYLAFMAWEYKISINGKDVKTPSVDTRSENVEIKFIETQITDNLPKNIMEEGKFILSKEKFEEYVKTEFKREPIVSDEEEDGIRVITYSFTKLEAGDVITIRLDNALIERMMLYEKINLRDDKIEITKTR